MIGKQDAGGASDRQQQGAIELIGPRHVGPGADGIQGNQHTKTHGEYEHEGAQRPGCEEQVQAKISQRQHLPFIRESAPPENLDRQDKHDDGNGQRRQLEQLPLSSRL